MTTEQKIKIKCGCEFATKKYAMFGRKTTFTCRDCSKIACFRCGDLMKRLCYECVEDRLDA